MSDRQALIEAFLQNHGWGGAQRRRLAGDASFRHYDRVDGDGHRAVLMDAPPPKEDIRPFVRIARQLERLGLSAPSLFAIDEDQGLLLLEDLGDNTYTRLLARDEDEHALYRLAIDTLIYLHRRTDAIPPDLPAYDDTRLLTEANLLVDWYMPAIGLTLSDSAHAEYQAIWTALFPIARAVPETLVLRDFHVDNLMLLPSRAGVRACGLLDFQDAVAGPVTYDLMSLMEDARRDIDPALTAAMAERWLAAFPAVDRDAFAASWAVLAAQRHAKVIGIFTRLCRRDGKAGYLVHIPRVWRLLERSLAHPALAPLADWLDRHLPAERRSVPAP